MTHKTRFIALGLLGIVAALGVGCCCVNWFQDPHEARPGGGGRVHRSRRWLPIFVGGWGGGGISHGPTGPSRTGSGGRSGTGRGGFGATGSHGGGSVGA